MNNELRPLRPFAFALELVQFAGATSLSMGDLASITHMSESSFYKHFKSITSTTPLHYIKELSLLRRPFARDNLVDQHCFFLTARN